MATPPTGLLKLPLELRQQIYHYVLVPTLQTRTIIISITCGNYTKKLHGLEPIQSIIFTNRLINHETLHYYFTHFIFYLHNSFYSIMDLMSEFYLRIGKQNRMRVRYIVIPRFSVDTPFFRGGYWCTTSAQERNGKYEGLVRDMELAFRMLRHFRALEEVQFGLYFSEVSRDKGIRPWVRRDDDGEGKEQTWDSYIMGVFGEAKKVWPTEKIGIWWDRLPEGLSNAESLRLQEYGLQQLQAKAAPTRVELVEAPLEIIGDFRF
ncbi:hypothetical protein COCMIDRAFT_37739 [Bipolaris oryzae ATCC 44560]|uniref:F-box domain-containing protein n=1 Tax=Bipolaris oryzae ATCC 44560 TaxID=930090 RepID=W6ZAB3_COCMI|nr:uncharacterized protein COCMIDRAFT_37739 [Bipolaris oryzae ATCC 44560]EUC44469.1 hypothetical protein COCMIDRAFT_37739 [Bipolaris oryzae ATCC 44560]